jgi:hypothetical protein
MLASVGHIVGNYNFETGQTSVQNNSQTVAVTNTPTLNTFRIPVIQSTSGLTISSERDDRCKMMAEGKIIDVAVKKTSTGYNNDTNYK